MSTLLQTYIKVFLMNYGKSLLSEGNAVYVSIPEINDPGNVSEKPRVISG